jgi:DNA-binding MarR family transcriptional regulator
LARRRSAIGVSVDDVNAPREAPPAQEPPLPPALSRWPGFLLGKLRQRALELVVTRTAELGIHPRHFGVMTVLDSLGPHTQQELADLILVNRTVMVGIVDELEAKGLVERRRNPADRRAYALQLTETGREVVQRVRPVIEAAEQRLLSRLSEREQGRLIELIRRVVLPPGAEAPPVLARHVGYLLALAERQGLGTVQPALAEIGLRIPGNGVLAVLADEGPQSQRALASSLRLNRSVMVQVVDELEAAGLVERRRNPSDRRAYALELTDEGHRRVADAERVIGSVHAQLLGDLGEKERAELHALLLRAVEQ